MSRKEHDMAANDTMNYDKENKQIVLTRSTGLTISVGFLILIATVLIGATKSYSNLSNQVDSNTKAIALQQQAISQVQTDNVNAKVQFSQIQEQLKSIDSNILDIKTRLR